MELSQHSVGKISQGCATQSLHALKQEFWRMADNARNQTEYLADSKLQYLKYAPLETLKRIFIQYRYFTIFYISDLALLVFRLPFGKLRSLLADFLNDELGNGRHQQAHQQIYDDFLTSLGIPQEELEARANQTNLRLLREIQDLVMNESPWYGVGLRGMGGECLCQVYLAAMHAHFSSNPVIEAMKDRIDWRFWDIHTGEVDIEHRELLRAALMEAVEEDPTALEDLVGGYRKSKGVFDRFWDNIFRAAGVHPRDMSTGLHKARVKDFHLAFPVSDLATAREFYGGVIGCAEGRSTDHYVDFDLYGHQIVAHLAPERPKTSDSEFDGNDVAVPHFGLNLDWDAFHELLARLKTGRVHFVKEPHIRLEGKVGEHISMFVHDPSGNALEFKAFRNQDQVFSKELSEEPAR
jgi:extradiol dioxygenase family protein